MPSPPTTRRAGPSRSTVDHGRPSGAIAGSGARSTSDASRQRRPPTAPSTPAASRRIQSSERTAGSGQNRMHSASASAPAPASAAGRPAGRHVPDERPPVAATARATPALANTAGACASHNSRQRHFQDAPGEGEVAEVAGAAPRRRRPRRTPKLPGTGRGTRSPGAAPAPRCRPPGRPATGSARRAPPPAVCVSWETT